MDETYGVNPHQSVEGMVAEYEKAEAKKDADVLGAETPKEEMEVNREAERFVQRGRLNADTGVEIPLTSKARKIASWNPSQKFLNNFDLINWG